MPTFLFIVVFAYFSAVAGANAALKAPNRQAQLGDTVQDARRHCSSHRCSSLSPFRYVPQAEESPFPRTTPAVHQICLCKLAALVAHVIMIGLAASGKALLTSMLCCAMLCCDRSYAVPPLQCARSYNAVLWYAVLSTML